MAKELKYKYKNNFKDEDKDKDAKRITETLTVCYIFGIPVTRPVQPRTAQSSLVPPSTV